MVASVIHSESSELLLPLAPFA
uniref:Uncharacterized protein n=1 Tax=Anguilla anguilla TaxID=7936 RepID=A0A0E9VFB2_ANGAN